MKTTSKTIACAAVMGLAWAGNALAEDGIGTAADADDAAIRAVLQKMMPGQRAFSIEDSPMQGISEVAVGTQVFYVSRDGHFVLGGPLVATADGSNLTEKRVAAARMKILDAAQDVPSFHYAADPAAHRITVITDIDCPYCRRFHKDMADYQALGIDVRYLMLPRAGKGSPSYTKTVAAACAEQPEEAITAAMNGQDPTTASCDNPIDEHMALARQLGATSTPTIVLEDGSIVLGHKRPEELLILLQARSQ